MTLANDENKQQLGGKPLMEVKWLETVCRSVSVPSKRTLHNQQSSWNYKPEVKYPLAEGFIHSALHYEADQTSPNI